MTTPLRASRYWRAIAALLVTGPTLANPPSAAPAAPAAVLSLSDEELRTAYAEVVAVGGMVYTYYVTATPEEAKLDTFLKAVGRMPSEAYVEKLGLKKFTSYGFSAPPEMRDVLRTTHSGRMSRKFVYQGKFSVVYVASAKYVPVPAFEQIKEALPKLVQAGSIPAPAEATQPPLSLLYAASRAHDVDALDRLAAETDINAQLPNGMTMLSNAVTADQVDLVSALLLKRHADPNICGAGICPLTSAVFSKNPPAMLTLLLANGANPSIFDADKGAIAPPLTMAVRQPNGIEIGELLLSKGADVDGRPSALPPLVGAAQRGDRAAIEMLLKHGADLYRPATDPLPPTNALTMARGANTDPKFQTWLTEQWHEVAKRSGRFQWRGSIEQDGKETPIGDKPIVLARKPFSIVVRMRPEARLMITASTERSVFDDFKDPQRKQHAPMLSLAAVVADVCTGEQRPLFLSGPSDNPKLNGNRVMSWSDSDQCQAFTASAPDSDGKRNVRTIGTLSTYDGDHDIATSAVPSLYFVVGTALDTVFPDFEYFGPKQFEIRFR